jgi:hypothetical protein
MYLRICGSFNSAKNLGTHANRKSAVAIKQYVHYCMVYSVRGKQLSYLCNLLSVSPAFFVCRGFIL